MRRVIFTSVLVFALCGIVSGYELEVSWIYGENPPDFNRSPEYPTTSDLIHFTIPTDVFSSQQIAEQALGGTPTLSIYPADRTIELLFQSPPQDSPVPIDEPVCGLEGYFGPLEQGRWLFFSQFPGTIVLDSIDVIIPSPTIFGYVRTDGGLGIGDVTMTFSNGGGTTNTDSSGYYAMRVPEGWSGTATPSMSGYAFSPPQRVYNNVTSDISGQNYIASKLLPPTKGRVKFIGTALKADEIYDGQIILGNYSIPVAVNEVIDDPNNLLDGITDVNTYYNQPLDIRPNSYGKVYIYGYYRKGVFDQDFGRVNAFQKPYYIIRLGDVSGNGEVSNYDALIAIQYAAGLLILKPEQIWAADVDDNGKVNADDVDLIEQYAAGSIERFPGDDEPLDYFTEQFSSAEDAFDLSNISIMFKPAKDGTSYGAYLKEITQLPTDPNDGIDLELDDDDYEFVALSDEVTVSIFGSNFSSFYVGSNGYITFTDGDNSYSGTLSDHFDTKRISCLFVDLNPSEAGLVSSRQLADRVAVTWENVPEYGKSDSNTFQVEMYFDGRIRLSWLAMAAQKGVVGLSNGIGVPIDFQETDISERYPKL